VTAESAIPVASTKEGMVREAETRTREAILEKASSIGLKSGE
jgi:hypothetical protein